MKQTKAKKKVPEIVVSMNYELPVYSSVITSPDNMVEVFRKIFPAHELQLRESLYALYLTTSNHPIGWQRVSVGCSKSSIVNNKLIIGTAIKCNAHSIVLCHNHPSGNLRFSHSDMEITKQLEKAGELFNIQFLDHIILTVDGWKSMIG